VQRQNPLAKATRGWNCYKAWNPPSALHPNIGVIPLSFDLVDTWNNKVIGGCTYFVNHPEEEVLTPIL
jgi:uncharacterized protein (DUF2126 family)